MSASTMHLDCQGTFVVFPNEIKGRKPPLQTRFEFLAGFGDLILHELAFRQAQFAVQRMVQTGNHFFLPPRIFDKFAKLNRSDRTPEALKPTPAEGFASSRLRGTARAVGSVNPGEPGFRRGRR